MVETKTSGVKPRKQPKQNRSRQMQADILEAAIRVLKLDGLDGFTTVRVAEVTGISVGSLYQYYPNKNSILFDLQRHIMLEAWQQVSSIIGDDSLSARVRISKITDLFFRAEALEVKQMGAAIANAEIALAKAQEFKELDAQVLELFVEFLVKNGSEDAKNDAAFLIGTLDSIGHYCATQKLDDADVAIWAKRTAIMVCDHLKI